MRRLAAAVLAAGILPACLKDLKSTGGTVLAAPAGLGGTAAGDGTAIDLTWTDASTGETGFRIEIAPVPILSDADITEYAIAAANASAYQYPAAPGITRYFRVAAFTTIQQSPWSDIVSVTTPDVPPAPSNLTAHVGPASDLFVALTWSDLANETGYDLERSPNGGAWEAVSSPGVNVTGVSDTTTAYDTEYGYRIRGKNGNGAGGWSDVVFTQTRTTSWRADAVSSGADDIGWFTSIAVTPSGSAAVTHYDAIQGATWMSSVSDFGASGSPINPGFPVVLGYTGTSFAFPSHLAVNANDNSNGYTISYFTNSMFGWEQEVISSAVPDDRAQLAVAPGDVPHVLYQQGTQLRHAWRNGPNSWSNELVSDNVPDYFAFAIDASGRLHAVFRRPAGGGFELVYGLKNGGSWSLSVLPTNGTPEFLSIALDAAGNVHVAYNQLTTFGLSYATNASGSWANETVHLTRGGSWGRFNAIAVDPANGRVHISYSDMLYENLRYARKDPGGPWRLKLLDGIGTVGRWTSLGLDALGNAYISYADTTNGDLKVIRNVPAVPQNLTAQPVSLSQIDLSWTAAAGASSYRIERSSDGGATWTVAATVGGTAYGDTGLASDIRYGYRVTALSADGESTPSLAAFAVPILLTTVNTALSTNYGEFTTIVVTSSGTQHVGHHDVANNRLLYTTGAPGGPYATSVAHTGAYSGYNGNGLDLDGSGVPNFSTLVLPGGTARLDFTTVPGSPVPLQSGPNVGQYSKLKIAPGGAIHVISYDGLVTYNAHRHFVRTGMTWSGPVQVTPTGELTIQNYTNYLDLDASGNPAFLFSRRLDVGLPTMHDELSFARFGSGVWTLTNLPAMPQPYSSPAFAFDSSGNAHGAYQTATGVVHVTNAGGTWTSEPIAAAAFVNDSVVAFAIDPSTGRLHVVYGFGGQLRYYRKDGSEPWVFRLLTESGASRWPSVALDGLGRVHIAARDPAAQKLVLILAAP